MPNPPSTYSIDPATGGYVYTASLPPPPPAVIAAAQNVLKDVVTPRELDLLNQGYAVGGLMRSGNAVSLNDLARNWATLGNRSLPNPLGSGWNPNDPIRTWPAGGPGLPVEALKTNLLFNDPRGFPGANTTPVLPIDKLNQLYLDRPGSFPGVLPGVNWNTGNVDTNALPQWRVGTTLDAPGHGGFGEFLNSSAFGAALKMIAGFVGGQGLNAASTALSSAGSTGLGAAATAASRFINPILTDVTAPTLAQMAHAAAGSVLTPALLNMLMTRSASPAARGGAAATIPAGPAGVAGVSSGAMSSRTRLNTAIANLRRTLDAVRASQATRLRLRLRGV